MGYLPGLSCEESPLAFGVVGCGFMGQTHVHNLVELDSVTVAAVCDLNIKKAEALAYEIGADAYKNIEDLLKQTRLDALVVATPPTVRQEIVLPASQAGVPLYVEKPPALRVEDFLTCRERIRESGIVNAIGLMFRVHPLVRKLQSLLEGRDVTLIRTLLATNSFHNYEELSHRYGYFERNASGGVIYDGYIHMFDLMGLLVGQIEQITARGARLGGKSQPGDVADTMVLASRLKSGALGVHQCSGLREKFEVRLDLTGIDFHLNLDLVEHTLTGRVEDKHIDERLDSFDCNYEAMKEFVESVRTPRSKPNMLPTYEDVIDPMSVVFAGERARESRQWEDVEALT